MRTLICFLATLPMQAAVGNLKVAGTTATQAVLQYLAPNASVCTVAVSESAAFTPPVIDTDAARFAGATLDSRPGSLTQGRFRVFVAGKRTVETAIDGRKYSRALAANTVHHARVTCGADQATVVFSTRNQAFGSTRPPDFPAGLNGLAHWPSINWGDRNERIIDPLTGAEVRKVSIPDDFRDSQPDKGVGVCTGTGWISPGDCQVDDAASATYSAGARDPLIIPLNAYTGWFDATYIFQMMRLNVFLKASIGGAPVGDDRFVDACLANSVTNACLTPLKPIDLTTCSATAVTGDCNGFGSLADLDFWGADFPMNAAIESADFALVLRPRTESAAFAISVQSVRYSVVVTSSPNFPAGPIYPLCSNNAVTDNGDGGVYYLCYSQGVQELYSVEAATGAVYHLSRVLMSSAEGQGIAATPTEIVFDPANPRVFYAIHHASNTLYKGTIASSAGAMSTNYFGARSTHAPTLSWTVMTPVGDYSLANVIGLFDSRFDAEWKSKVGTASRFFIEAVQAGKLAIRFTPVQDGAGWVVVFDPAAAPPAGSTGQGNVIAARHVGLGPADRFCGIHTLVQGPYEQPWVYMSHGRIVPSAGSAYFQGPWTVRVRKPGGGTLGAADTVFEMVANLGAFEPTDPTPSGGVNDLTIAAKPGDLFAFNVNEDNLLVQPDELVEVVSIDRSVSPPRWTVRRGTQTAQSYFLAGNAFNLGVGYISSYPIPDGTQLYSVCRARPLSSVYGYEGETVWNFVADPKALTVVWPMTKSIGQFPPGPGVYPAGSGYASPIVLLHRNIGSHADTKLESTISDTGETCLQRFVSNEGCWGVQQGKLWDMRNDPLDFQSGTVVKFAGVYAANSALELHPSYLQNAAGEVDRRWALDVPVLVTASGTSAASAEAGTTIVYGMTGTALNRKHFPTAATSGGRVLRDISGPAAGDSITDATPYTFCVARAAGECRADSAAGAVYVAVPGRTMAGCYGSTLEFAAPGTVDVCVTDQHPWMGGVIQIPMWTNSFFGEQQRIAAYVFPRLHSQSIFASSKALPNGKWTMAVGARQDRQDIYLVKLTPYGTFDSVNRGTFVPVRVEAKAPAGAALAAVEFGYADYGAADEYFCTSRKEACVAVAGVVSEADPFAYAGAAAASGVSCAAGCAIEIPGLSGRTMYYRIVYKSAGGEVVAVSAAQVAAVP